MTTWKFWRGAIERAVKTFAQGLIAVFTAAQFDILAADWQAILITAATSAGLSVLTSIVSEPIGERDSASALSEPQ